MHNRLLPALLGGAGGLRNRLILFLLFFLLPPERWGHRGRICLSHGPRWPPGGGCRVGGGLQANPESKGQLERAPHRLRDPSLQKLPGPHIPSSGFGAIIRTTLPTRGPWYVGPAPITFPRPSPPFFSRQSPESRPPPPRVCLSQDTGCFAPPLLRGPPLYPSYLGRTGLETKADTRGTGIMGCWCRGK